MGSASLAAAAAAPDDGPPSPPSPSSSSLIGAGAVPVFCFGIGVGRAWLSSREMSEWYANSSTARALAGVERRTKGGAREALGLSLSPHSFLTKAPSLTVQVVQHLAVHLIAVAEHKRLIPLRGPFGASSLLRRGRRRSACCTTCAASSSSSSLLRHQWIS
jgi:hypothetical protein